MLVDGDVVMDCVVLNEDFTVVVDNWEVEDVFGTEIVEEGCVATFKVVVCVGITVVLSVLEVDIGTEVDSVVGCDVDGIVVVVVVVGVVVADGGGAELDGGSTELDDGGIVLDDVGSGSELVDGSGVELTELDWDDDTKLVSVVVATDGGEDVGTGSVERMMTDSVYW